MCSARGPASCDDGLAGRGPPPPPGSSPSGVCVRVGRTQLASAPGGGFSLANSSQGTAQSIGCHPGGGAKGPGPCRAAQLLPFCLPGCFPFSLHLLASLMEQRLWNSGKAWGLQAHRREAGGGRGLEGLSQEVPTGSCSWDGTSAQTSQGQGQLRCAQGPQLPLAPHRRVDPRPLPLFRVTASWPRPGEPTGLSTLHSSWRTSCSEGQPRVLRDWPELGQRRGPQLELPDVLFFSSAGFCVTVTLIKCDAFCLLHQTHIRLQWSPRRRGLLPEL